MKLLTLIVSRSSMASAVLAASFALFVVAMAQASEPSNAIRFKMFTYLQSGLSAGFPTTYLFDQSGSVLAVFAATTTDAEKLRKVLHGVKTPEQLATVDARTQGQRFEKYLAGQGVALKDLVDTSHSYTLVEIGVDDSVGGCPPCEARHSVITDGLARKDPLDAAFREIILGN